MSAIPVLCTHQLLGSFSRCIQLKAKREASKQMTTLFHSFPTGLGHGPAFSPPSLCSSRHRTGLTPWKRQPWLSNTLDRNLPLREHLLGLVWSRQCLGSPLRAGECAGLQLSSPPFPVQRQHSSLWEYLRCFMDCNMTQEVVYLMNYIAWLLSYSMVFWHVSWSWEAH